MATTSTGNHPTALDSRRNMGILLPDGTLHHPNANADGQLLVEAGYPRIMGTDITRPANTTPYAANDVVSTAGGAAIVFTNMARANGGSGWLTFAQVVQKVYVATPPSLELWIFGGDSAPASIADNSEFSVTPAEANNIIARIPLTTVTVGFDGNGTAANGWILHESGEIRRPFECGASTRNLFGILRATGAYTPLSAEVYRPYLSADVR
jgi:hypothetical protein